MKQFFKFFFASALGSLFSFIILLFIGISICIGLAFGISSKTVYISSNSVLQLDFSKSIHDREVDNFSVLGGAKAFIGMNKMVELIRKAKGDNRIQGIFLDLSSIHCSGWATVEEIRNALLDFKQSDKFIYAYGDMMSQNAYYLATVADKIALNPVGHIDLRGLSANMVYLKDFFDKFDVKVDLIRPRNNAYKNAGEMFLSNKMSNESREQTRSYMNGIWNHVSENIAKSRDIQPEALNTTIDNVYGFFPKDALSSNLIDTLCFKSDIYRLIERELSEKKVAYVTYENYKNDEEEVKIDIPGNRIAVIYAYGDVKQGKRNEVSIGSETIVKSLREAAEDDKVKAIVLRINSGGGDAIASEMMTHEVFLTKEKKPIIVSMGDLAASAGYEMACGATKILAYPTTITGSIGVFGILPEFGSALKKHMGINFDTISTHRNSIFMNALHPSTTEAKMLMQRNVESFYLNFCERVATGRNLNIEFVDSIARGRVWSGTDAKKLGLIDEFGGLFDAVRVAAEIAEIEEYSVKEYPTPKTKIDQIMEVLSDDMSAKVFHHEMGTYFPWMMELKDVVETKGVQARIPYIISFN